MDPDYLALANLQDMENQELVTVFAITAGKMCVLGQSEGVIADRAYAMQEELMRRLTRAVATPPEGMAMITKTALYRVELWARAYPRVYWETYDQHMLDEIKRVLSDAKP